MQAADLYHKQTSHGEKKRFQIINHITYFVLIDWKSVPGWRETNLKLCGGTILGLLSLVSKRFPQDFPRGVLGDCI